MHQIASQRTSISKKFSEKHALETSQKSALSAVLMGAIVPILPLYTTSLGTLYHKILRPSLARYNWTHSYYMIVARKQSYKPSLRVFIFRFVNFEGDNSISLQSCKAFQIREKIIYLLFYLEHCYRFSLQCLGYLVHSLSRFCRKFSKKMSLTILAFFAFCC